MKLWSLGLVVALLLTGSSVWAAFGPRDNALQNLIVDPLRGWGAQGELLALDDKPLDGKMALILIPGIQEEIDPDYFVFARAKLGAVGGDDFRRLFKLFEYRYDYQKMSWQEAGEDLAKLIEARSELTRADIEIRVIGHSNGGLIGGKLLTLLPHKVSRLISLGTPWEGSYLADRATVKYAFSRAWPKLRLAGDFLARIHWAGVEPLVFTNFDGTLPPKLSSANPKLTQLKKSLEPYRQRIFGYAGELPRQTKSLGREALEFVGSGYLFGGDQGFKNRQMYQVTEKLIQQFGVRGDGMASTASALAGIAGDQRRLMRGYHHREIVDGKTGDTVLYEKVWQDLIALRAEVEGIGFADSLDHLPAMPEIEIAHPPPFPMAGKRVLVVESSALVAYSANLEQRTSLLTAPHLRYPEAGALGIALTVEGRVAILRPDGRLEKVGPQESFFAGWYGRKLVYQAKDALVLHDLERGEARVLVRGLSLKMPPVVDKRLLSDLVYFLTEEGRLYRMNLGAREKSLSKLVPVLSGLEAVTRVPGGIVALSLTESGAQIHLVSGVFAPLRELSLTVVEGSGVELEGRTLKVAIENLRRLRTIEASGSYLYFEFVDVAGYSGVALLNLNNLRRSLTGAAESVANQFGYTLGLESQPQGIALKIVPGARDLSIIN